jgi:uncharacterized membrane protein YfcA
MSWLDQFRTDEFQGANRLLGGILCILLGGLGLYIIPELKLKLVGAFLVVFGIWWAYSSRRFLNKLNKPPKN